MSNPYKIDPNSKAVVYNNKKERDRIKLDKTFKNHLHKEVQFLSDCINWLRVDYEGKLKAAEARIAELEGSSKEDKAK